MLQLDGHRCEVSWNMLSHKLPVRWSCSSCDACETLSFPQRRCCHSGPISADGWDGKWRTKKKDFLKIFKKKHFDPAGWKLRYLTGIHACPCIFVSVLSNVPNFISQWMFLYVKRWEGKSIKNWCSWVFCEEARLGREKERSRVLCQLKALITQLSSCWNSKMPTWFSPRWPSSNRRANHREYK